MFELFLGVIIGGAVSILEKHTDPISFGISKDRIKEIEKESFNKCFSEEFMNKIEGNPKNDWYK